MSVSLKEKLHSIADRDDRVLVTSDKESMSDGRYPPDRPISLICDVLAVEAQLCVTDRATGQQMTNRRPSVVCDFKQLA